MVCDSAAFELRADDGGALDDGPLFMSKAVEPGFEERVDRGRDRRRTDRRVLLDHHCEHLLDEERVSFGGSHDRLGRFGLDHGHAPGAGWITHRADHQPAEAPLLPSG